MSISIRRDDEINDSLSCVPRGTPQEPPIISDLRTTAPEAADGGIDLQPPRVRHFEASAVIENMRGRWLLDPEPATRQAIRSGRKSVVESTCRMLFVFFLLAIVVFLGITLMASFDEARKHAGGITGTVTPPPGDSTTDIRHNK